MKKVLLLTLTLFAASALFDAALMPTTLMADEITFSFILGTTTSLNANPSGLQQGPAINIVVSDANTGKEFALAGTFTASTGTSSSFNVLPNLVIASYNAGGSNSVMIVDPKNNPLVLGDMRDHASFLSSFPNGAGAFLGAFDVTFVSPAVLAMFGLGPEFEPIGSVSTTFAHDDMNSPFDITGQLGGGTVTIESVPEPATIGMFGLGLAALAHVGRKLKAL